MIETCFEMVKSSENEKFWRYSHYKSLNLSIYLSTYLVSPDAVENCTVMNKSSESFYLRCAPGFDGGLNQTFNIQVHLKSNFYYTYSNISKHCFLWFKLFFLIYFRNDRDITFVYLTWLAIGRLALISNRLQYVQAGVCKIYKVLLLDLYSSQANKNIVRWG